MSSWFDIAESRLVEAHALSISAVQRRHRVARPLAGEVIADAELRAERAELALG